MLRIALTDDHTLFRESLRSLINNFQNMQVVINTEDGKMLLTELSVTPVDILILDLQMPEMDGFEVYRQVKENYPHIKTLILTFRNEPETIKEVLKMGAQGYFTKSTPPKELEEAIWNLEYDGFYFEKDLTPIIKEIYKSRSLKIPENKIAFTERELEIIRLTAQGLKPKQIAETLSISTTTVNTHKQNIRQKYGFDNMIAAIVYCFKHKIINISEI